MKLPKILAVASNNIIFKSMETDFSNLLIWLKKRTVMFFIEFLKSSMSCLIKQIKKITDTTGETQYAMYMIMRPNL